MTMTTDEELRLECVRLALTFGGTASRAIETAEKIQKYIKNNTTESESESNLVNHARTELSLLGEDVATIEGYIKMIQIFADMGHSGGSASVFIPTLNQLLQFKNLTPLTNDPEEWMFIDDDKWGKDGGIWQNRRNSEAFSNDGGKNYYLLSDDADSENRRPLYASKNVLD